MSSILSVESLTAGYGKISIVKDVTFEVQAGEIVTMIGINGAGKSTLLKTVAGLLPIMQGNIFIEGKNLNEIPSKERAKKLAVLLTDKIHSDYMTVYDVIATGRYAYTGNLGILSEEDQKKVEEAIELMNLTSMKEKLFDKLSDGQKQRVMLARAICQETKIIILDEPTSFLDIGYKIEIMSMLKNLASKGIAVLMTLHDLEIARQVSDSVISIKNGCIHKIGSPEELLSDSYLCQLFDVDENLYQKFYG